eukprot:CAMPEP_0179633520 /NCGR_PEP_ID=MMETSP0932-20121108/7533_1 /TAXON_ID=548131 ORGANISM="Ostreococcus mediterraneus, Strain clade-D-RCC2596" /NCGR_SAMPLE_ID=MMETSP0932 /ASSEMBLY_ACC=CAM_ASM_000582 /LENGTH=100 /DNA_ID=CAMNT_0021503169 /DNA_START=248 /DNA_END=550 /DNA_ORIENTATION=+
MSVDKEIAATSSLPCIASFTSPKYAITGVTTVRPRTSATSETHPNKSLLLGRRFFMPQSASNARRAALVVATLDDSNNVDSSTPALGNPHACASFAPASR